MAYVATKSGAKIDIGANITKNINSAAMIAPVTFEPENLGSVTTEARFEVFRSASNTYTGAYGGWYKVPDDSIEVIGRSILESVEVFWKLPNGSRIPLLEDIEVKGIPPLFHWGTTYGLTNCYVKLNAKTLPGFRAFNMLDNISPDEVKDIIGNQPKEPLTPPTTGEVVQSSLRSLVILAILGTAIYFLPKNIVRG